MTSSGCVCVCEEPLHDPSGIKKKTHGSKKKNKNKKRESDKCVSRSSAFAISLSFLRCFQVAFLRLFVAQLIAVICEEGKGRTGTHLLFICFNLYAIHLPFSLSLSVLCVSVIYKPDRACNFLTFTSFRLCAVRARGCRSCSWGERGESACSAGSTV
jgi:hypothetical protein